MQFGTPTPVGEPCVDCGVPFTEGDSGEYFPVIQSDLTCLDRPIHTVCATRPRTDRERATLAHEYISAADFEGNRDHHHG